LALSAHGQIIASDESRTPNTVGMTRNAMCPTPTDSIMLRRTLTSWLTRLGSARFRAARLAASLAPIEHFSACLARLPSHRDLEALARASELHEITVWAQSGTHRTPMQIRLIAADDLVPATEVLAAYRLGWQACPCEGEGRTGVQTAEIAAACRQAANQDGSRHAMLAVCPADARHASTAIATIAPAAGQPQTTATTDRR
jgi:hypothetical protein